MIGVVVCVGHICSVYVTLSRITSGADMSTSFVEILDMHFVCCDLKTLSVFVPCLCYVWSNYCQWFRHILLHSLRLSYICTQIFICHICHMYSLFCLCVCFQVISWHGKGLCIQLFFLVCFMPGFHHWHHTYQHILPGLFGGLLLFHAVWRHSAATACTLHT